tara:strand:- start:51 stop:791 length:741 start_codon:yes stop_codon:yes gene_type:complete
MKLLVLLLAIVASASALQLSTLRTAPQRHAQCAARTAVLSMCEAEAADDAAAADAPAPAPPAKEEEGDDLLNSPAFLKQKLKVLQGELEKVTAETEEAKAAAELQKEEFGSKRDRLEADFENFKERHYKQTLEKQVEAKSKLVEEFLSVLDNFDRARGSIATDGPESEAVNSRYQLMHAGLMASLEQMGVAKIPTVGEPFDYNMHMAISKAPSDYDEDIVCEEMQAGFTCEGNLVRAAYVMVSMGQ